MKLNKEQKRAVDCVKGPLLIVAGAGTGKTSVITEKIKFLIGKGVKPQEILALTFTEKAAEEMLERLDTVMPYGYEEPWVSTFHRFGERILRQEGLEIGLNPTYEIISGPRQYMLLKENLFEIDLKHYRPLGNPGKFVGAMLRVFSRAGDERVSAKDLLSFAESRAKSHELGDEDVEEAERIKEVARAMDEYKKIKLAENVMDFADLINWTIEVFKQRKTVLSKYQKQFKHVLVDEFQDTNFAQYELVKLLAPPESKKSLTVVGDDSQSIYRFRGAAISNILTFMDDYKEAERVVLTDNYRSNQAILDGAYKLIQNNNPATLESRLGISKNLTAQQGKSGKEKPLIVKAGTGDDEVEFVVSKIYELLSEGRYSYGDFAILARANSQLEPYVAALKQHGLPYRRIGNRGLFDQEEIRLLLQFLRVVVDPGDSMALFDLLYYKGFKVASESVLDMLALARRQQESLWNILKEGQEARRLRELIEKARAEVGEKKPSRILFEFVEESGYVKALVEEESIEQQLKLNNLNKFFRYVRELEGKDSQTTIVSMLNEMENLIEAGENPAQAEIEDVDAVSVTTAHSAKGLEFGVVFVVNVVAGRFPSYGRRDPIELPQEVFKQKLPAEDKTAEERRLFYVAMTRAKDRLFLSWASDYGGVKRWKPSGFLAESGLKETEYKKKKEKHLLGKRVEAQAVVHIGARFKLSRTSFSQIDTFKACPLKYKYRYVLKVPAEPHHSLSFGQSVHKTLQEFHLLEVAGKKPTEKKLLALYEKNFIDEGYESKAHKKERFEAGKAALKEYFGKYKKLFGKPWKLEEEFSLRIAGVRFVGKIDRIDKVGKGYEIVDYKTGKAEDKKKVDKDEQLSVYALATKESLKIKADKLSLYFLENGEKVETKRSEAQIMRKRKDLEKTIEEMKGSAFEAKPSVFVCGFCEFNKICPYAVK